MNIYLDYAATTPLRPDVKQYIIELLDKYQNPSSLYQKGAEVRQIIDQSRRNVAGFINAKPEDIVFTSSGSSSNTLGIKGYIQKHDCCVLYSPIAHKSILKCVEHCEVSKYPLTMDHAGFIDVVALENLLDEIYYKPFVVIDYANSEIGTIQNVKKIIDIVHSFGGAVMLDCTGSISTIQLDVGKLKPDLISFSGHKLGALKGCGVLYKNPKIKLEPLVYGSQESGLFAGTENVLGIASLGKAVENYNYSSALSEYRDYIYEYIIGNISDSYLVGAPIGKNRLSNNLYVCIKGVQGESLMTLLDINGVQVSTGSACVSGDSQPSPTLTAIGMNKDDINSCIRLSFGENLNEKEVLYICAAIDGCVKQLRNL